MNQDFPVIAMCGSAGSLQAYGDFFKNLPNESGCAYIIVMHLAPDGNVDVTGLFAQFTTMSVVEARDGIIVLPNHIYVIPPNKHMGFQNNKLLLFNINKEKGINHSIDFFLQSLAEEHYDRAVVIIFSGMGNDGTLGVKAIIETSGMVMVQDPETAQFKGMPEAVIKANKIDFILSPEEMPKKMLDYISGPAIKSKELVSINEEYQHAILQKILLLLRAHIGHDFTLYKKNTIVRRIERRIAHYKLKGLESYFNFMTTNVYEMDILFKEMLIGVTKFFRDTESYHRLKPFLYQKILEKKEGELLRVWIAGCSTGEEAYSIAMLIAEFFDDDPLKSLKNVQIFATDLDHDAIETARLGFYPASINEEISAERLDRFFDPKNKGYVVKKELREMIVFAKHNLIKDAPFTRLDLLCCRNVMIYFSAALQKKLLPVFHYSLKHKGILFLGPAETIGIYNEAFTLLDHKWKIFERNNAVNNITKMIDFPFNIVIPNIDSLKSHSQSKPQIKTPMTNSFQKILINHYTPASLLVNDKGDILYINGDVNKYLQLNAGEAVMNIHSIMRAELRYPIANALHQVYLHQKSLSFSDIKISANDKTYSVGFNVDYLHDDEFKGLLVITFKDGEMVKLKRKPKIKGENSVDIQAIADLEKELSFTKQQLHSTIEQMESSVEELKSTNEELQSTNEELQSTNEEALTTKEEMQSLNEELMTINLQYHTKAEELTRLNNDMKNLLDNTEIGTIFLDNNLNILRFTPQVTKLFNVIPQDVGRSITHIVSNFDYPAIESTVVEVIERLAGKELEVKTKKNEWYNLRIMPYRTLDNFINGAVLTFTKITPLKSLEYRLSTLVSYVQTVVDDLTHAAVILDHDQKVLVVNKAFLKLFNVKEQDVKEQFFMEIVVNRWKTNKMTELFTEGIEQDRFYVQHVFPSVGLLKLMVNVKYITQIGLNEHTAIIVTFENKPRTDEPQEEQNHLNN